MMKKAYLRMFALLMCLCMMFLQGCTFIENISTDLGIDFSAELSASEVYNSCARSVVEITAKNSISQKTGTGFFCDTEGTVITNYHVIEGCTDVQISLYNNQIYMVNCVIGYDAARDIAILDTNCTDSVPLEFGVDDVYTGQTVYTLGSSLGLTGTFSDGIVSCAKRVLGDKPFIQVTAPISPGNSGGPLLNTKGKVIGINTACMIDGQNLNFAIPIADVSNVNTDTETDLEDMFTRRSSGSGQAKLMRSWSFGWSDETENYVLSFELCDATGNNLNMSGIVEIEIVNDNGKVVYQNALNFSARDCITVSTSLGAKKLAAVYISASDIYQGDTFYGEVSFRVSGTGFSFDEATARASDLPAAS